MANQAAYGAAGDILSALTGGIFGLIGTGMTNQANQDMNNANIALQDKWNLEAMKRYDTEFEYNKALQQQVFEREDTAMQRQVADMAKAGINPLSQTLSGANAGQAVGLPNPVNGQAPQNTFAMQNVIAGALEGMNALSNLNTQGIERDKLRAEENYQKLVNESQALDNLIKANKNGVTVDDNGNLKINKNFRQEQDITESNYQNNEASRRRNQREDTFQENFGAHDLMSQAGRTATDVAGITYRAGQGLGDFVDSTSGSVKSAANSVGQLVKEAVKQKVNQAKQALKDTGSKIKNKASGAKKTSKWIYDNFIKLN